MKLFDFFKSNRPKVCPKCNNTRLYTMYRYIPVEMTHGVICKKCDWETWYPDNALQKIISKIRVFKYGIYIKLPVPSMFFKNLVRSTKWFFRGWKLQEWDYDFFIETNVYKLGDMGLFHRKLLRQKEKEYKALKTEDYKKDYEEILSRQKMVFRQICHLRFLLKRYNDIQWSFTKRYDEAMRKWSKLNRFVECDDKSGCSRMEDTNREEAQKLREIMHEEEPKNEILRKKKYNEIYKALRPLGYWWD